MIVDSISELMKKMFCTAAQNTEVTKTFLDLSL